MNVPTEHQIITHQGRPAFVVVPWEEYRERFSSGDGAANPAFPWTVGRKIALEGKSPVRAWREYLELSQEAAAERIGVSRAAYAQMESPRANLRVSTLGKIARAFGVPLPLLVVERE